MAADLAEDLLFLVSRHQIWRASLSAGASVSGALRNALLPLDEAMESLCGGVRRIDPQAWAQLSCVLSAL
jgi:hypothetical protein